MGRADDLWDEPYAEERAAFAKEARDRRLNKGTENQVHYSMKKLTKADIEQLEREGKIRTSSHPYQPEMIALTEQLRTLKVGDSLLVPKTTGVTDARVRKINQKFRDAKEKIRVRITIFVDESAWVITRLE